MTDQGTEESTMLVIEAWWKAENDTPTTANNISDGNVFRHYYNKYQEALHLYKTSQLSSAQTACRDLEFDFECPRLIQVQACQLGSKSTMSYWSRKTHLEHGVFLLSSMNGADQVVIRMRQETEAMLAELEQDWKEHWEGRGLPVPNTESEYWKAVDEDTMEEEEEEEEAMEPEDHGEELELRLKDLAVR